MNPGAWFRLALCLVMLHGQAAVSSEEAGRGDSGGDAGENPWVPGVTGRTPELKTAEVAARGDVEGDGNLPRMSAKRDGGTTVSVVEGSDPSVDATGEAPVLAAGCDGRRFKKCR